MNGQPTPTIINEPPPNFKNVCGTFRMDLSRCIFTYGDKIYNPSGQPLPDHIIAHESVHIAQQTWGKLLYRLPEKEQTMPGRLDQPAEEYWWGLYLRDNDFRIEQEAQAYAAQYDYIARREKNKAIKFAWLLQFSKTLSGPIYGHAIGMGAARRKIEEYVAALQ